MSVLIPPQVINKKSSHACMIHKWMVTLSLQFPPLLQETHYRVSQFLCFHLTNKLFISTISPIPKLRTELWQQHQSELHSPLVTNTINMTAGTCLLKGPYLKKSHGSHSNSSLSSFPITATHLPQDHSFALLVKSGRSMECKVYNINLIQLIS